MTAEAIAFLDAIFDSPGDDTPKLVYADWLEEHGHGGYAEFIRVCCQVAKDDWPTELRAAALAERRDRIGRLIREWEGRAGRLLPIDPRGCHRRGIFEGTVRTTAAEFLADAGPWFPLLHVRWLQVTTFADVQQARAWAAHPCVGMVRRLALGSEHASAFLGGGWVVTADCVAAVLASPHFRRLDRLVIGPVAVSRRFLRELVELPAVRLVRPDAFELLARGVGTDDDPDRVRYVNPGRRAMATTEAILAFLDEHGERMPAE